MCIFTIFFFKKCVYMSSSTDYYQYLKYVKNSKFPPSFLSENGGATSTVPIEFSNHNISLKYNNPLIVNKDNELTLDLSASYVFDNSNIYMRHLPLISGELINNNTFYITIDNSGRLGYQTSASINELTNILSKPYIASTIDMSNQAIDKIKYTNYLNDIDIRQNTLKRIYTSNNNLYLNPLGSLILNGNNIDVDQGKLLNVKDINGAFDQDINIKTAGYGNISLQTETFVGKKSSILMNRNGYVTINGNVINIGDENSIVNIFGTTKSLEITNTYSNDQIITLNKDGTEASTYGCGFQIDCINSETPVGYIKTSGDGMTYDVGVPGDLSTNYTMLMTDPQGNISTIAPYFSINDDRLKIDMYTGDTSIYGLLSCNKVSMKSANVNGNLDVSGDINLSGNTIVYGETKFMDNVTTNSGINIKGDTRIAGNTNIGGNIDIIGDTNIGGTLDVIGNTTIQGKTDISGHTCISGDTNINGVTNMSGDTNIGGTMDLCGNATIYGLVDINGDTKIKGNLSINGLSTLNGNTSIKGNTIINGDTLLSNNATVKGNTIIGGDIMIGNNTAIRGSLNINKTFTTESDVVLNGQNIMLSQLPDGSNNMYIVTYNKNDTKKIGYKSINDLGILELREEVTKLQNQNNLLQSRISEIEKILYIYNQKTI